MWAAHVIALAALYFWLALRGRASLAGAIAVSTAMVFPAWLQYELFQVPSGTIVGAGIDVKVAVGIVVLLTILFMPGVRINFHLTLCDLAMLGLAIVHLVSDTLADGLSIQPLLRIYGEWFVPYVAGRVAIQSLDDLRDVWRFIAVLAAIVGVLAIVEGVSRSSLFEQLYGLRPLEQTPRDLTRWGMRRAYGPCLNPIYFGLLQMLLLGWALFAAALAVRRRANRFWMLAPIPLFAGIVCTGSRGQLIGLLAGSVMALFLHFRRLRPILAIAALCTVLVGIANREPLIVFLETWSGEADQGRRPIVLADGELEKFSGTRNRLVLFDVYKIAFKRCGLYGFGTGATTGFPVRVPLGEVESETLRRVRFVDNAYALLLLRFGYLGCAMFVCAGIAAVWQLARVVDRYRGEDMSVLAGMLASAITGVLVSMLAVWMPHDYGFALLWMFGLSSSIYLAMTGDQLEYGEFGSEQGG